MNPAQTSPFVMSWAIRSRAVMMAMSMLGPHVMQASDQVSGTIVAATAQWSQHDVVQEQRELKIPVVRLPWRVALASLDGVSGSLLIVEENSSDLWILPSGAFESDEPVVGESITISGQVHDVAVRRHENGARFVVRTKQGELFWVDTRTLALSRPVRVGPVSKENPGYLRVGTESNLVYTSRFAGREDPSIPTSLVAINIDYDPPRIIEIRGSKRIATAKQFAMVGDESAAITLTDKDHGAYFPLTRGALGDSDEPYLRVLSSVRNIHLPSTDRFVDLDTMVILSGPGRSGIVLDRSVRSADAKSVRGTLPLQPLAAFEDRPWVVGIANLSVRIASLETGRLLGTVTLPRKMLQGLPYRDAIDQIGLPYAPIRPLVLPDPVRHRLLVILGDHVAMIDLAAINLPHLDRAQKTTAPRYSEELDIHDFAISPDRAKIVTLAGHPHHHVDQSVSLYDRQSRDRLVTKLFTHKLRGVALGNDRVYVIDGNGVVTQLAMDTLEPLQELEFRCQTLEIVDSQFALVDEKRLQKIESPPPSPEGIVLDESRSLHPDQAVATGWLREGVYRATPNGAVGLLFEAADLVGGALRTPKFDFWDLGFRESPVVELVARRTRENGTLLCPPQRCQTMPIQIALVQSVVEPSRAGLADSAESPASQIQVTLEVRNLVNGRLVKQYPLLRESLEPGNVGARLRCLVDSALVLYRGNLFDIEMIQLRDEPIIQGPSLRSDVGPRLLPLQRQTSLTYQVDGGTLPLNVSATAVAAQDSAKSIPLVTTGQTPEDRSHNFEFDLEMWLRHNLKAIAAEFDQRFHSSSDFDAEASTLENLKRYLGMNRDRLRVLLGRDATGIPIAIGIQVSMVDASQVACSQLHYVLVEIPARSLIIQIDLARRERRAQAK